MKIYEIRDPVHGFIEFNDWEKEIIAHPAFQRLRRIRQLALTDMIYPGAMHSRFEHSLGVMHLVTKMFDSIIKKEENKKILKDLLNYEDEGLKRDRQIIRFAGLLHDIGHAPFSHVSEELMPKNPLTNKPYKHEDYTIAIIIGPLKDVIEKHKSNVNYGITANEIADMIKGDPKRLGKRIFWKILISSQLDADRCDYLLRDSIHLGVKYGIYDLDRLLVTLKLAKEPEAGDPFLGIEEGGWHVAESIVIARYQMFTQVYYQKTRRAYDFMLKEALKKNIETYPPPDKIDEFLKFDDYKAWMGMLNDKEWFANILNRNHLRVIYETKEMPSKIEKEKVEKIEKKLSENKIWFWKDRSEDAKSWYDIENEDIQIIDSDGNIEPLSTYSNVVRSLRMRYEKIRIYVKAEDKDKASKLVGVEI